MNLNRYLSKKELVDLTKQLVRIPTENPPGNEKQAVLFLKPILSRMGFKVKTLLSPKGRWNIVAERKWGNGGRRLIFNGHLDPLLGKPTFNIGTIQGGTKINVVPDRCEIELDRRMLPGEKKEEMLKEIKEILNSVQSQDPFFRYQIEEIDFAEPSEIDPEEEIVKFGLEAIQEVRREKPKIKGFSGFTDARSYVNQCHIPALIFGPGEVDQSHTTDESVGVDALIQAAHIYGLIILKYLSV